MFCKQCGLEIDDDSVFCSKCGAKLETVKSEESKLKSIEENNIENDVEVIDVLDSPSIESVTVKKSSKKKFGILLMLICFIASGLFIWQNSLIVTVKNAYDCADYETAYDNIDKIWNKDSIADYELKVEVMHSIDHYYQLWKDDKYDSGVYSLAESWAWKALQRCVGYSQEAIAAGCNDRVDDIAKEIAQWLANKGKNVESTLKNQYNGDDSYGFSPLYYMGTDDDVLKEIKRVGQMVSKTEATNAQNERNPLKISGDKVNKDGNYWYCTGTVSNVSKTTHDYVQVRVTYYDANSVVLTTDWTYAVGSEGIRGGENQQFEIMTKVDGKPERYKVEIMGYD